MAARPGAKPIPEEITIQIKKLYEEGYGVSTIGLKLRYDQTRISRWVQANLKVRSREEAIVARKELHNRAK